MLEKRSDDLPLFSYDFAIHDFAITFATDAV